MKQPKIIAWLKLFWMFFKINILTTSGPASIGLLYKETVGTTMTESQFVESVGFSNLLPGSEALKLAMFVGYTSGGIAGTITALFGSILPPTLIMLALTAILERLQGEEWMKGFVSGLSPAVAMLMAFVAWKMFRTEKAISKRTLLIAALSLVAYLLNVPPPLVLFGAGILGVILFR